MKKILSFDLFLNEQKNEPNENDWKPFLNGQGYLKVSYWTPIRNKIKEAFPKNHIRLGQTIPKSMRPWNIIMSDTDPLEWNVKRSLHFYDSNKKEKDPNNNMIEYLRPLKNDKIDVFKKGKKVTTIQVIPDQEKMADTLIKIINKHF